MWGDPQIVQIQPAPRVIDDFSCLPPESRRANVLDLRDKVSVVEEQAVDKTRRTRKAQEEEREFLKLQNEHLSTFLQHT